MPRSGRVAMMETYDNLEIPDDFSILVRGNEAESSLEYEETYYESKEAFDSTREEEEEGVKTQYASGRGTIILKAKGTRKEILGKIFREISLQAKFYYDEGEIAEMLSSIKVLSGRRE